MRKTICIFVAGILILAGSAWSAKVTDVELSFGDGFTRARLAVDGEVEYSHQTVEARDGKPFRVILDVENAVHELPAKSFAELPSCPITAIRTSQFAANPVPIVRLVFDMRRPSIYRVDTEKGYLTVFFADNAGKEFPVWTASGKPLPKPVSNPKGSANEKYFAYVGDHRSPAKADPSPKSVDKPAKSASELNKAMRKDRIASLKPASAQLSAPKADSHTPNASYGPAVDMSTVPVTKKETPVAEQPKVVAQSETPQKPTPQATTKPPAKSSPKARLTSLSNTVPEPGEPLVKRIPGFKPYANHPTEIVDKPTMADKQQPIADVASVQPEPQKKPTPPPASVNKPAVKQPVPTKATSSASPTVAAKPPVQKPAPKPVVKPGEVFGPNVDMALVPRTAKPEPKPSKTMAAVNQPESTKPAPDKTPPKSPKVKSDEGNDNDDQETIDRDSRRKKSTSRFRRNPVMSKKMKGTLVAEFPKRLVVKYRAQTRRDPFETLINEQRTHNNPVEQRVANVDGLRLVGVIEAEDGANRALFEDQEGYGYILKSGDKVRNGYVLRVESNRVYFQIFEYGWSRTVALKIDEY